MPAPPQVQVPLGLRAEWPATRQGKHTNQLLAAAGRHPPNVAGGLLATSLTCSQPPDWIWAVSPIWKSMAPGGGDGRTTAPCLVLMYKPASASGHGICNRVAHPRQRKSAAGSSARRMPCVPGSHTHLVSVLIEVHALCKTRQRTMVVVPPTPARKIAVCALGVSCHVNARLLRRVVVQEASLQRRT